jgi:hypothetical protein
VRWRAKTPNTDVFKRSQRRPPANSKAQDQSLRMVFLAMILAVALMQSTRRDRNYFASIGCGVVFVGTSIVSFLVVGPKTALEVVAPSES